MRRAAAVAPGPEVLHQAEVPQSRNCAAEGGRPEEVVLPSVASAVASWSCPALVGRDEELRTLVETVGDPPSIVLVAGEAGVGKTRLVEALLDRPELDGHVRLVGGCQPLRDPFPLGPVIEALRGAADRVGAVEPGAVCGALRPLLPELAVQLPEAPEPLGDARAERHRLFRGVVALLEAVGPAVMVLEDLHWADADTLELLAYIADQLPAGLSVVCTYRGEELEAAGSPLPGRLPAVSRSVRLPALGGEQIRRFVAALLDCDEVSEGFADWLHERTGGVPFALEELLGLLHAQQHIVRRDDSWLRKSLTELPVPPALRDAVLQRLHALPDEARAITRAAAVTGEPATEQVLAAVAGLEGQQAMIGLSAALVAGLLQVGDDAGRYRVRHGLAAEAIYDAVPAPQRRRMHLRAAGALESRGDGPRLARLADHHRLGGDVEGWARCAEAAADLSVSLGNDAATVSRLGDLLAAADLPDATRGRIAVKFAKASLNNLAHIGAIPVVRDVLDGAELAPEVRGELRWRLGALLHQAGDPDAACAEVIRCVPDLEEQPQLLARAMASIALMGLDTASPERYLPWLDRAVAAADAQDDPLVRLLVHADRAAYLMVTGDAGALAAADALPAPTTTAVERRHRGRVCSNLSYGAVCLGHYRHARRFLHEGRQLAAAGDASRATEVLESTGMWLDWCAGRWEGLAERIDAFLEADPELRAPTLGVRRVQGLLWLAQGRTADAEEVLTALLPEARQLQVPEMLTGVAGGYVRLLLTRADPQEAATLAADALTAARGVRAARAFGDIAVPAVNALLAADGRDRAARLVQEATAGLDGRDAPAAHAALAACRGLVAAHDGDGTAGVDWLTRAERAWRSMSRPYEAAQAREHRGALLLSDGDRAGTQPLLDALETYEQLGGTWDADRTRATLRLHGADLTHRRGRKAYGDRLSPRERQVAELAATGRTNRQIGEELFISPRTVEGHVARALRKLDCPGRDHFASALADTEEEKST